MSSVCKIYVKILNNSSDKNNNWTSFMLSLVPQYQSLLLFTYKPIPSSVFWGCRVSYLGFVFWNVWTTQGIVLCCYNRLYILMFGGSTAWSVLLVVIRNAFPGFVVCCLHLPWRQLNAFEGYNPTICFHSFVNVTRINLASVDQRHVYT